MTPDLKPEAIQSVSHPDADLLSAFAENALPQAEQQQMLAHLATCPDCRQILALALPVDEPLDLPLRHPGVWTRLAERLSPATWRLAGASFALAGLILGTVLLMRPAPPTPGKTTPPAVLSAANRPVDQAGPTPPEMPSHAPAPAHAGVSKAPTRLKQIPPGWSSFAEGRGAASDGLGKQGPSLRLQQQAKMPLPPAPAPSSQAPRPLASANGSLGVVSSVRPLPPPSVTAPVSAAENSLVAAGAAPVTAAAPPRPLAFNARSVTLGGAVSATHAEVALPGKASTALPGDRAILASAARGPLVIAVNDQHNAFLSRDAGAHWQPVLIAFAGHAVSVRVQPLADLGGTITDAAGAAIPGARVTLNGGARRTTTDAAGRFSFNDLPSGSVRLEASRPGFETLTQNLKLDAGTPLRDDLQLQVGQASETVNVTASTAPVELATDQVAAPVDSVAAARKAKAPAAPAPQPASARAAPAPQLPAPAQFELVMDDGQRFTSGDGRNWLPVPPHP